MSSPKTDLKIVDGVLVKLHHFVEKNDTHETHAHQFDHITLLASGSVKMVHDKGEAKFNAPHLIVTPKGIKHQFTALEPNTVFCCIHAIREKYDLDIIKDQHITKEQALELLSNAPLTKD